MASIFSYDVFDSVVCRAVSRPSDVFSAMSKCDEFIAMGLPERVSAGFFRARVTEEILARFFLGEGITLRDIYDRLGTRFSLNRRQIEELARLEKKTEEKLIYPIASVLSEIDTARAMGKRIVFISDMYLPEDHIRSILKDNGAYMEGDGLYVSGSCGKSKTSGELFKHIFREEKCRPCDISHYGDDLYCDVFVPMKLGMGISGPYRGRIITHNGTTIFRGIRYKLADAFRAVSLRVIEGAL